MNKKPVTVGTKEAIGFGVIGLALISLFLPMMIQRIADLEFIKSEPFAMLSGSSMVLGIFILIAGIAIILAKFDDEEE
jgi:uncharacterized membrane protein